MSTINQSSTILKQTLGSLEFVLPEGFEVLPDSYDPTVSIINDAKETTLFSYNCVKNELICNGVVRNIAPIVVFLSDKQKATKTRTSSRTITLVRELTKGQTISVLLKYVAENNGKLGSVLFREILEKTSTNEVSFINNGLREWAMRSCIKFSIIDSSKVRDNNAIVNGLDISLDDMFTNTVKSKDKDGQWQVVEEQIGAFHIVPIFNSVGTLSDGLGIHLEEFFSRLPFMTKTSTGYNVLDIEASKLLARIMAYSSNQAAEVSGNPYGIYAFIEGVGIDGSSICGQAYADQVVLIDYDRLPLKNIGRAKLHINGKQYDITTIDPKKVIQANLMYAPGATILTFGNGETLTNMHPYSARIAVFNPSDGFNNGVREINLKLTLAVAQPINGGVKARRTLSAMGNGSQDASKFSDSLLKTVFAVAEQSNWVIDIGRDIPATVDVLSGMAASKMPTAMWNEMLSNNDKFIPFNGTINFMGMERRAIIGCLKFGCELMLPESRFDDRRPVRSKLYETLMRISSLRGISGYRDKNGLKIISYVEEQQLIDWVAGKPSSSIKKMKGVLRMINGDVVLKNKKVAKDLTNTDLTSEALVRENKGFSIDGKFNVLPYEVAMQFFSLPLTGGFSTDDYQEKLLLGKTVNVHRTLTWEYRSYLSKLNDYVNGRTVSIDDINQARVNMYNRIMDNVADFTRSNDRGGYWTIVVDQFVPSDSIVMHEELIDINKSKGITHVSTTRRPEVKSGIPCFKRTITVSEFNQILKANNAPYSFSNRNEALVILGPTDVNLLRADGDGDTEFIWWVPQYLTSIVSRIVASGLNETLTNAYTKVFADATGWAKAIADDGKDHKKISSIITGIRSNLIPITIEEILKAFEEAVGSKKDMGPGTNAAMLWMLFQNAVEEYNAGNINTQGVYEMLSDPFTMDNTMLSTLAVLWGIVQRIIDGVKAKNVKLNLRSLKYAILRALETGKTDRLKEMAIAVGLSVDGFNHDAPIIEAGHAIFSGIIKSHKGLFEFTTEECENGQPMCVNRILSLSTFKKTGIFDDMLSLINGKIKHEKACELIASVGTGLRGDYAWIREINRRLYDYMIELTDKFPTIANIDVTAGDVILHATKVVETYGVTTDMLAGNGDTTVTLKRLLAQFEGKGNASERAHNVALQAMNTDRRGKFNLALYNMFYQRNEKTGGLLQDMDGNLVPTTVAPTIDIQNFEDSRIKLAILMIASTSSKEKQEGYYTCYKAGAEILSSLGRMDAFETDARALKAIRETEARIAKDEKEALEAMETVTKESSLLKF